ncbi:MAG: hypothetical protein WCD70_15635 [Alphaproteobacteria bacterium]
MSDFQDQMQKGWASYLESFVKMFGPVTAKDAEKMKNAFSHGAAEMQKMMQAQLDDAMPDQQRPAARYAAVPKTRRPHYH